MLCCDGLPGLAAVCCGWLREGLCLMLVAAGMVGLLFTWQLAGGHLSILEFLVARGADVQCSRQVSAVDERDDVAACVRRCC